MNSRLFVDLPFAKPARRIALWLGLSLAIAGCVKRAPDRVETSLPVERWIQKADLFFEHNRGTTPPVPNEENYFSKDVQFKNLLQDFPPVELWPQLEGRLRQRIYSGGTGDLRSNLQNRALLAMLLELGSNRPEQLQALLALVKETTQLIEKSGSDKFTVSSWQSMATEAQEHFDQNRPELQVKKFEQSIERQEAVLRKKDSAPLRDRVLAVVGSQEKLDELDAYLAETGKVIEEEASGVKTDSVELQDDLPPPSTVAAAFGQRMKKKTEQINHRYAALFVFLRSRQNEPALKEYVTSKIDSYSKITTSSTVVLNVPDLITLVGPKVANDLLQRALRTNSFLEIERGGETIALARGLASAMLNELKVPQWGLTKSITARSLFEAMEKKFGDQSPGDEWHEMEDLRESWAYEAMALAIDHQPEQALAQIRKAKDSDSSQWYLPYELVPTLRSEGYSDQVWKFLNLALIKYPDLNVWDDYFELSSETGRNEEALALTRKIVALPGLKLTVRLKAQQRLANALLAANQVDTGCAQLQSLASASSPQEKSGTEATSLRLAAAVQWAEIARLNGNAASFAQATVVAQVLWGELLNQTGDFSSPSVALAHLWIRKGNLEQASRILTGTVQKMEEVLKKEAVAGATKKEEEPTSFFDQQEVLGDLIDVLTRQQKYQEALHWADSSILWEESDLGSTKLETNVRERGTPVAVSLAKCLLALGRNDQARKILEAQIMDSPDHDDAYAIWMPLAGDQALTFLDQLYGLDQFESRPLIWKAKWLLAHGNPVEAEIVAQNAVNVDPSDGEQGFGRRMLVYSVMSDIELALNRPDRAEFFAKIVKAIRMSEQGDEFYEVSLYQQAITLYQRSLGFFQNAYCIQSRLALRLSDQGKSAEAAEHYRRAYELMPSSFGRVESHCFGCEGAFRGRQAQSVADRVFTRLLESEKQKPQIHYLMGYLRDEEERYPEALKYFQEAVQLDQQYLNAWKKIASIEDKLEVSPETRDAVLLKLIELDPTARHDSFSLSETLDLPRVWMALRAAQAKVQAMARSPELYPFPGKANSDIKKTPTQLWGEKDRDNSPEKYLGDLPMLRTIESCLGELN